MSTKLSPVTITHWNKNQDSGREQEGGRWRLEYKGRSGGSREKHFNSLDREQEQQTLPKLQRSCVSRGPGARATTVSQVSGEQQSQNTVQSHGLPADGKS